MTKTELEEKIKKGESVWVVLNEYSYEYDNVKKIDWTKVEGVELHNNYFQYFDGENLCGHYYKLVFKTKAEAEHYLHHANVTRTEILPFLTWEEFLEKRNFSFRNMSNYYGYDYYDEILDLYMPPDKVSIRLQYNAETIKKWEATEENFYKAYDECVRLFKGDE